MPSSTTTQRGRPTSVTTHATIGGARYGLRMDAAVAREYRDAMEDLGELDLTDCLWTLLFLTMSAHCIRRGVTVQHSPDDVQRLLEVPCTQKEAVALLADVADLLQCAHAWRIW